jgi:Sec7-like guanine-nucleotide exchange factor
VVNADIEEEDEMETVSNPMQWLKRDIMVPEIRGFTLPQPIETKLSMEYFSEVFTNELLDHIVFQTNLYVTQKDINTKFSITSDEMRKFLGINVIMGVILLPSMDDYWKMNTRIPQVANAMSRDRFKMIRSYLHFNDNDKAAGSTDRFFKVRPLLDGTRAAILKIPETPLQSVDEVMIAYKGTRAGNLRQYIASKPDK